MSVVCKSPLDDRLTQTEDWQATITLMCTIKHQNVVQLCGFTAFPGSMVLEDCTCGTVKAYVAGHAPNPAGT